MNAQLDKKRKQLYNFDYSKTIILIIIILTISNSKYCKNIIYNIIDKNLLLMIKPINDNIVGIQNNLINPQSNK